MANFYDSIKWAIIWEFLSEFILPNLGKVILSVILFIFLGLILSTIFTRFLYKKNFFHRDRKYYNWIVKLWIPYIIILFLYFSAIIGCLYKSHSVLLEEKKNLSTKLYSMTFGSSFASEKNSKDFLDLIQKYSNLSEKTSTILTSALLEKVQQKNTGIKSIDNFKNSSSSYLIKTYQSEIYAAFLYSILKSTDEKIDIKNIKDLQYSDFKILLKNLNKINPQKIEQSIQAELENKIEVTINYAYTELLKHELILFILFLIIPFIEYFIYVKFVKKSETNKQIAPL
ncbi:hypothetical protein SD960_16820 [Flavobacterium sp. MMLR14_040]|uniref:hypothetical protein n=1 Tax=Flavobacterium sp. MMLR14_040 TaxID=3093843 RepID=UPI00298F9E3A|nr:hypothetical protein [Flavobacterium sp. MMLR14_040]MDW8851767.1 hypothetical protein [Flavobacterium sp. MMLR14_040]